MATSSCSISQAYCKFSTCGLADIDSIKKSDPGIQLVDIDGTVFLEDYYRGLMLEIIRRNDVKSLRQYLTQHPLNLAPGETDNFDPYWVAAYHGSTEALYMLLNYHTDEVEAIDKRGFILLNVTCQAAQLETARFLLDHSQQWLQAGVTVDIHARDKFGMTALLSAAASFKYLPSDLEGAEGHDQALRAHLARAEDLMHLLLDRGASSADTNTYGSDEANHEMKVRNSVLSLAISRGSAGIISRLLATGAQADTLMTTEVVVIGGPQEVAHNVTPVHIGALYSNFQALQVLLEHNSELIKVADTLGCLPLHWAAAGPGFDNYMLSKDDIAYHVTETLTLLLSHNCSTINVLDMQGKTALHYVCAAGEPQQVVPGATLLCEHGANAALRDPIGRTPLHYLIQSAMRLSDTLSEVELLKVISVLIKSGAKTNDADTQQIMPLHLAARNLGHVQIVKLLLEQGASASAANAVGNTPVHEAARGNVGWISTDPEEERMKSSAEFRIKKQDEMMNMLLKATGSEELLDRPNSAGQTPRIIQESTRNRWRAAEKARIERMG